MGWEGEWDSRYQKNEVWKITSNKIIIDYGFVPKIVHTYGWSGMNYEAWATREKISDIAGDRQGAFVKVGIFMRQHRGDSILISVDGDWDRDPFWLIRK